MGGREEVKGKELPHRPIHFSSSSAVLTSQLHALLTAITQNYGHVDTASPLLSPHILSPYLYFTSILPHNFTPSAKQPYYSAIGLSPLLSDSKVAYQC